MKEPLCHGHILFVHPGALGDLICSFPVILRLIDEGSRVDLLAESRLGRLAAHLVPIQRYLPLESAVFSTLYSHEPSAMAKKVLKEYDSIVCLSVSPPLVRSLRQLTGVRSLHLPPRPDAESQLHITEYLKGKIFSEPLSSSLDNERGARRRKPNGAAGAILLHPGSGSRRKNWPLPRFLAAAELIAQKGYLVRFLLGPAEIGMKPSLEACGFDLIIVEDLVILAGHLSTAAGYLGNDSGVSHLAAFLGVPTVAVFGPSDPRIWAPVGSAVATVRGAPSCRPCFEIHSKNCEDPMCLTSVTPKNAVELLLNLDDLRSFL